MLLPGRAEAKLLSNLSAGPPGNLLPESCGDLLFWRQVLQELNLNGTPRSMIEIDAGQGHLLQWLSHNYRPGCSWRGFAPSKCRTRCDTLRAICDQAVEKVMQSGSAETDGDLDAHVANRKSKHEETLCKLKEVLANTIVASAPLDCV